MSNQTTGAVEVPAAELQEMLAKTAAKAAKQAAKAATRAAEERLNTVDPATRPGGSGATVRVNLNRPSALSISRAIRAMATGSWKGAELERDWTQAARAALPFDGRDEAGESFIIPATRAAAATVATYAGIKLPDTEVGRISSAVRDMAEDQTISITGDTAGGALVPPQFLQSEFTLSAQSAVVVKNAPGVDEIPVTSSQIFLPRETALAEGDAYAEGDPISPTDSSFARQQFVISKLAALAQYSNELLADSNPALDAYLSRSLARRISLLEDREFLMGDGAPGHIQGIVGYSGTTTNDGIGDMSPLDSTVADKFIDLVTTLREANVEPNGWVMHPKTLGALSKVHDDQGRYLLQAMGGNFGAPVAMPNAGALSTQSSYQTSAWRGMLLGLPVLLSTQLDDSSLILGDWNFARILRRQAYEIAVSPHILFTTNQTAIRVISRVQLALTLPEAFTVVDDISYGS